MTEQNRCEDNIAFVNSFFQLYSGFRADVVKDQQEKTEAIQHLLRFITKTNKDVQDLMSEMIRLAKAVENTQKDLTEFKVFFINHKPTVIIPRIAKTTERKSWKFWQ